MSKPGIIRIGNKDYKTVSLRVYEFREKHPLAEGWGILTEIVECNAEIVIIRAIITHPEGRSVAVGLAEEKRNSNNINKTSALENCETSAIGRALAAAGFGGSEYASADELVAALNQQNNPAPPPPKTWSEGSANAFHSAMNDRHLVAKVVFRYCESHKWGAPSGWPEKERTRFIADLDRGAFKDLYNPNQEPS